VRILDPRELGWPVFAGTAPFHAWLGAPAATRPTCIENAEDPVIDMALNAAGQALQQARVAVGTVDFDRIACVLGTSKGGLDWLGRQGRVRAEDDPADWIATLWDVLPPSIPARRIANRFNCRGPVLAPIAACATGLVSLCQAAALIRDGACDLAIAGSSDASLQPAVLGSFRRLGVLAPAAGDPGRACRPFDSTRSGFAVGEGAGVVILERWEHAVARRVPILAEWIDGLQYADPYGLTLLDHDPAPLVRLISDLLRRADVRPSELDAVSVHGTATRINDAYEAQALARACGSDLSRLAAFGVKGGIGHLLGAAGSVETVISICALQDQVVPPTINCDRLDDACPLPLSSAGPVRRPVRQLLKLSLGFGGHLAAGLLRAVEPGDSPPHLAEIPAETV
jgi:3-oxoacyl-[acyl-carrier-protein] synthase II